MQIVVKTVPEALLCYVVFLGIDLDLLVYLILNAQNKWKSQQNILLLPNWV